MTRKDYVALAAALTAAKPTDATSTVAEKFVWIGVVGHVADALQADNPRFSRDRFLQACGCDQ